MGATTIITLPETADAILAAVTENNVDRQILINNQTQMLQLLQQMQADQTTRSSNILGAISSLTKAVSDLGGNLSAQISENQATMGVLIQLFSAAITALTGVATIDLEQQILQAIERLGEGGPTGVGLDLSSVATRQQPQPTKSGP